MDNILYTALTDYYHTLENTGYMSDAQAKKLLVLVFFRDFIYNDYRGVLTVSEYKTIEEALDCLFGTSCLIPYSEYTKMSKLKLGQLSELAKRVTELENANVLKTFTNSTEEQQNNSDIELYVLNE